MSSPTRCPECRSAWVAVVVTLDGTRRYYCRTCAHEWTRPAQ